MEIGARIRALRKEQNLSLERLANRGKVALASLSRIENGKGGGTYRTHRRIAEALGISIAELYRGLEEPEAEAVLTPAEAKEAQIFSYDEKASAVLLTSQVSAKNMLPQMILLHPGGKTALEQYGKGTERWLFCMEGKMEATVGEKSYPLRKGATLYLKASLPHRLVNPHRSVAKVISVTSPTVL